MLPVDLYNHSLTVPAYIDPGTGSLIIQVLIGVLAGAAMAAKVYWARIKGFFRNLFSHRSQQTENDDKPS